MTPKEIVLIDMPFADVTVPSLALTQLKYVVEQVCPDRVSVRILYLNHDFAQFLGPEVYQSIAREVRHHNTGFGDWFFRQAAFPELADNADDYLTRYYPKRNPANQAFVANVMSRRQSVNEWCRRVIDEWALAPASVVGFTSMFAQNTACIALARALKALPGERVVMIGGANCEHPMGAELAKNVDVFDYVFSGPALVSFPSLISRLDVNPDDPCGDIRGVLTRRGAPPATVRLSSGVTLTARSDAGHHTLGAERDIDDVIPLEFDEFLDSFEAKLPGWPSKPSLTFETSRGCWWGEKAHCTFCGLNGSTMRYRAMEAKKAIAMFESLFRYADRCGHLQCVDNILPQSYFRDVLPYLNTPPHLYIFYEVKADLDEDDVRTLADGGVRRIQPGIEALATSTLKLMKKGTNAFQNITLLKHCASYDVGPSWNLLIGFPRETEDVYEKYLNDIPRLTHLPPPNGVFPIRFDRFSPYFVEAEAYGLDLRPYDYYGLTYPFSDESLAGLAYYFADQNYEAPYFVAALNWMDRLQAAVAHWNRLWQDGRRPQLEMFGQHDEWQIFDSRGEAPASYRISNDAVAILKAMAPHPASWERLSKASGVDGDRLHGEVNGLRERGLIFEEGGRMVSLVMQRAAEREMPQSARELRE